MILSLFAHTLSYPDKDTPKNTVRLIKELESLSNIYPEIQESLDYVKVFYYFIEKTSLQEREEVYTQTFEVQSITTLDVGYVLFGDDYKRAELLVNLNQEVNKYGIETGHELADYLPNVLKVLDKMEDVNTKTDLIIHIVYPALKRMINDFDSKVMSKKNEVYLKHHKTLIEKSKEFKDIYLNLLVALKIILESVFKAYDVIEEDKSKGFLSNIEQELNIEKLK